MTNNVRNVYALTRNGNALTDEGMTDATEMLKRDYDITEQLVFSQGMIYNDPVYLAKKLKNDVPTAAIIVVEFDRMFGIANDKDIQTIANDLENYPDASSWELLMSLCEKASSEDQN